MSAWTEQELAAIGAAEELVVATRRSDGTLRPPRTIWMVRRGDTLYVRSVNGRDAAWFRGTRTRMAGHISAGGVERDVEFRDADPTDDAGLDEGYRSKYDRSSAATLDRITSSEARAATVELLPL